MCISNTVFFFFNFSNIQNPDICLFCHHFTHQDTPSLPDPLSHVLIMHTHTLVLLTTTVDSTKSLSHYFNSQLLCDYNIGVWFILQVMVYSNFFLSQSLWLYSHKCSDTGAHTQNMTPQECISVYVCDREREEREKASERGRRRER